MSVLRARRHVVEVGVSAAIRNDAAPSNMLEEFPLAVKRNGQCLRDSGPISTRTPVGPRTMRNESDSSRCSAGTGGHAWGRRLWHRVYTLHVVDHRAHSGRAAGMVRSWPSLWRLRWLHGEEHGSLIAGDMVVHGIAEAVSGTAQIVHLGRTILI